MLRRVSEPIHEDSTTQCIGADLVQNVYILDPSLAVEEGQELSPEQERLRDGVEVLIFSSDEELFPQASPGDIIRFHRVQVPPFPCQTRQIRTHNQPYSDQISCSSVVPLEQVHV
jgi:hypothetical protein